jgi:putative lipoprotein
MTKQHPAISTCKVAWIWLAILAGGYVVDATAADATLAGIANYRERVALPATAVFEATLEDVSRADAPAIMLGKVRITAPQRIPVKFSITYDAQRIVANHRYVVRIRVVDGEQLLFVTDSAAAVDFSQSSPIEVNLRRAVTEESPPTSSVVALENTNWRLTTLGNQSFVAAESKREPFIRLQSGDKSVVGFGGCNQMMGAYTLNGDKLSFSQLAGTMMACQGGMETESAFHAALGKVARWRIGGQQLELLDAAGMILARFEQRIAK